MHYDDYYVYYQPPPQLSLVASIEKRVFVDESTSTRDLVEEGGVLVRKWCWFVHQIGGYKRERKRTLFLSGWRDTYRRFSLAKKKFLWHRIVVYLACLHVWSGVGNATLIFSLFYKGRNFQTVNF